MSTNDLTLEERNNVDLGYLKLASIWSYLNWMHDTGDQNTIDAMEIVSTLKRTMLFDCSPNMIFIASVQSDKWHETFLAAIDARTCNECSFRDHEHAATCTSAGW